MLTRKRLRKLCIEGTVEFAVQAGGTIAITATPAKVFSSKISLAVEAKRAEQKVI